MTPTTPEYKLFQKVLFPSGRDETAIGTITGIEYVAPAIALCNGTQYGWFYTVRIEPAIDKPIENLIGVHFDSWHIHESDIELPAVTLTTSV